MTPATLQNARSLTLALGTTLALAACGEGGSSSNANGNTTENSAVLRCNEVMYNAGSADSLEWIEIQIASGAALSNMQSAELRLEGAVEYLFPAQALAVGERVVVASDTAAFRAKYPPSSYPVRLFGPFSGRLDNNGEVIEVKLSGPGDASCRYSALPPWPSLAAGLGSSLVYVDGDASQPESYGPSKQAGGNPGGADTTLPALGIRVNEVQPGTALTKAWIELYNASATAIDASGWILADNAAGTSGYTLPAGTTLAPGAYLKIDETAWPFEFYPAQNGDNVYLVEVQNGTPTGVTTGLSYPALVADQSAGIATLDNGLLARGPLANSTPGALNAALYLGPVYVSEIHYNPPVGEAEFIEIANRGTETLDLFSPAPWKIEGIAFQFPAGATLAPGAKIVLVRAEDASAESFRASQEIAADVAVYAYAGKLSNRGESLIVQKPLELAGSGFPYTWSDAVLYEDSGEWPSEADGEGQSLVRTQITTPGENPAAWTAAAPSPGK